MERRPTIKKLSVRRRHHGLTARDRTNANNVLKVLRWLVEAKKWIAKIGLDDESDVMIPEDADEKMNIAILKLVVQYRKVAFISSAILRSPLPKIDRKYRTIDSFVEDEVPLYFRFRNKEQLKRLKKAFHIGEKVVAGSGGHVFTGDEFLLVSLYRLHRPTTILDACFRELFGLTPQQVSLCVVTFVNYVWEYWGYLVLNNMEFWKPFLPARMC